MHRRLARFAIVLPLAASACMGEPPDPQLQASATYQAGYNDGCATAAARARVFDRTVVRNGSSYDTDKSYHRGWNVGYRACGSPATQSDPYSEPVGNWQKRGGPLG